MNDCNYDVNEYSLNFSMSEYMESKIEMRCIFVIEMIVNRKNEIERQHNTVSIIV